MLRTARWAWIWSFVRIAAAVLGVAAVIAQLQRSTSNALQFGWHVPTVVANFLSFFTIQSNLIAAVTLTIGAIWWWRRGRVTENAEPQGYAVLLLCATTYVVTTGVVYNLLLRNIPLPQGQTVAWSNEVLHVVIPLVMLLDLLFAPRRRALACKSVLVVVIYPVVWVIYTLLRGPLITSPGSDVPYWYPYPFLNPNNPELVPPGYAGVAVYVIGIAIGIVVVAFFVVWVGRRRAVAADAQTGAVTAAQ